MNVTQIAQNAKRASEFTATAATEKKNQALDAMAEKLEKNRDKIIDANKLDLQEAAEKGISKHLIDRLRFSSAKIDSRIRSLIKIRDLPEPIGSTYNSRKQDNGLDVCRVRVPLGVILMIYEARPHVTVNAGAFCLKSGNAAVLRGGSEAKHCNDLIGKLWCEALNQAQLPPDAIQIISGSHRQIAELLQLNQLIDLVIPRGGKGLIKAVSEKSKIPVVKHYSGVCHVYFDELDQSSDTNIQKAIDIALDSKCLMPEVCNAMETLLVAERLSSEIPEIVNSFKRCGVKVKGCEKTRNLIPDVEPATQDDWRTEYLDNIVSIRIVSGVDQAVKHINTYGSHHTDSIVTANNKNAEKFTRFVDSSVVLVNASTMFCDGESLGMGAEIGISTDKIHARGPMGLEELTSYKFVIRGNGHLMGKPETFVKKTESR